MVDFIKKVLLFVLWFNIILKTFNDEKFFMSELMIDEFVFIHVDDYGQKRVGGLGRLGAWRHVLFGFLFEFFLHEIKRLFAPGLFSPQG